MQRLLHQDKGYIILKEYYAQELFRTNNITQEHIMRNDLFMQSKAHQYAQLNNRKSAPKEIHFADAAIVHLSNNKVFRIILGG